MNALGKHLLIEYYECDVAVLDSVLQIERHMVLAAEKSGATIVRSVFHAFNPFGVSGVIVIAESHMAIHTWPEHGYAAVDIFTCGDAVDPRLAERLLRRLLGARHTEIREITRGELTPHGIKFAQTIELSDVQVV